VVLRLDERKGFSASVPLLSRNALERAVPAQNLETVPAVPLIARDSFVAETATKIDQLQASFRILTREVAELVDKVTALQDAARQDNRWHAFLQSGKRTRKDKLDETLRACRDLKTRLDKMEARSNGNYHAYTSFEAVSRKLAELEHFKDEAQRVERNVTMRAWLFCGALLLAVAIIVVSNLISG